MFNKKKNPTSNQDGVIGISWEYRCGWSGEHNFERVYKSVIDGVTVWKNATKNKTTYTVGENGKKYKSEQELIEALKNEKD